MLILKLQYTKKEHGSKSCLYICSQLNLIKERKIVWRVYTFVFTFMYYLWTIKIKIVCYMSILTLSVYSHRPWGLKTFFKNFRGTFQDITYLLNVTSLKDIYNNFYLHEKIKITSPRLELPLAYFNYNS